MTHFDKSKACYSAIFGVRLLLALSLGELVLIAAPVATASAAYQAIEVDAVGDLGFSPKGLTDDSRKFQRAFASKSSITIHFPPGLYSIGCPAASNVAGAAISIVGAGEEATRLVLSRGCTLSGDLLKWDGRSNFKVADLSIDLTTSRAAHLVNIIGVYAYAADVKSVVISHVKIIGGAPQMALIGFAAAGGHRLSDTDISDNYLALYIKATSQNYCFSSTTNHGTGHISYSLIANVCVNSGMQNDGDHLLVADNDISGFGYGTGLFAPPGPSGGHSVFVDNHIHDSGTALDSDKTTPGGFELDNDYNVACNNTFDHLAGGGIINFGQHNFICNNVAFDNGNAASPRPGTGDKAGFWTPSLAGHAYGAYSTWIGNKAYDGRGEARQVYGYFEARPQSLAPGIVLEHNDFKGSSQSIHLENTTTQVRQ